MKTRLEFIVNFKKYWENFCTPSHIKAEILLSLPADAVFDPLNPL